ncbi:MAG: glycosyltransferase family 2 protein [Deltaproteobacteria bacterium]|nr:glycosyltransferase family 2 protein [Deltaproteobacteria bacterium]
MPKISVIMAAYNCADSVSTSLESIANQTFEDWECIVCDDGSIDGTWETICAFQKANPTKFKCIRNQENMGPAYSRNRCIDLATGEYVAIQDADDFSYSQRLEKQVRFLDSNPEVAVVGTYAEIFDRQGNIWGIAKPPLSPTVTQWIRGSCVVHASVLMRKTALQDVGLYNAGAKRDEDYELFIKMLLKGYKIVTIPEILYRYKMDFSDYKKRKFKYRLKEAALILKTAKETGIPFFYYAYALRPLICGLVPSFFLYKYHRKKFRNT